jgi:hypothetical protein
MNERKICMDSLCSVTGVPKNSFGICLRAKGAGPFPMFQLPWGNGLRMLSGQYRTISIVQYLRRRGAKQVPAEEAGVCRHDDEIEFVRPSELNDLSRRVARQ